MAADSFSSDRSASPLSNCDQSDREAITLRFFANDREIGSIIGKRGDNVKKVREESGCRINISDASLPERIVTTTGLMDEIIKAYAMISEKFEQDAQHLQIGGDEGDALQVMFRFIIPNSHCGSLIGKSGSNIKELREMTGAAIQVANEMLPSSTERVVTVSGSTDAVMQCIQRLCIIASETKSKIPTIPYQPQKSSYGSGMFNGRDALPPGARNYLSRQAVMKNQSQLQMMGEYSSPLYSNQNAASNSYSGLAGGYAGGGGGRTQTHEITIPNHTIGSIIGKQGTRINGIRQSSQAIIKIGDLEAGSTDRRVTITGSPASINSALYLINGIRSRYNSSSASAKHL